MRKLFAIAWSDIRIEFSERSTLVFFFILPIIFTLVIGLGLQNLYGNTDPNADPRYVLLVVDEDNTGLSAELRQTLNASTVIRPVYADPGQAAALFDEEEATALLTIPAGYEAALLGQQPVDLNLKKVAGDNTVFAIEEAVRAASSQAGSAVSIAHLSTQQAEAIRPFDSPDARQAYFNASLETARERLADPPASTQASQAPEVQVATATGFEQSSPGQLVTWTLITLVGAAEVFVNERLGGTLRRLFVTPTRMVAILTGKITGRLAMGMLQMALLIGFGALFLKVNWGRSPGALALVVLTFGLAAVAFGVMLGTFARTRGQASGMTVMFSMLLSALGGAWWPLEITPPFFQAAVRVLPTTWAMTAFNDVIVRGQGLSGVLPESAVLVGFAIVFFVVGVVRMRVE